MSANFNPGVDQLTDKEKEALRLLLVGHDAKSSANELDISVHTVNDRLRAARRKLSVSSSREAARILGAAEGQTPQTPPQKHAHEEIGMGQSALPRDNADLTNESSDQPKGWVWLTGGMLIMSIAIAIAIAVSLAGSGAPASAPAQPSPSTQSEAEGAVQQAESLRRAQAFLAEVDAGDWKASWEAAGPIFQAEASAEEWTTLVEPVRSPLGEVTSRELVTVQRTNTLPGAPDAEYEVLQFRTQFAAAGRPSIETLFMVRGEDGWEVNGYFIA
ncbi:MAG: DUF4019 domain-containing protein [Pseudomonadota bacterium]